MCIRDRVIPSIIIAMVWQAIGYYMVMYMASMSAVPISLYAVSYTHLDVYKRQMLTSAIITCALTTRLKDHAKMSAQAAFRTKVLFRCV